MICSHCQQPINDAVAFCPFCGAPTSTATPPSQAPVGTPPQGYAAQPGVAPMPPAGYYPPGYKPRIPGRGFGIASMVLGIIGAVYSLPLLTTALEVFVERLSFFYVYHSTVAAGVVCMTVFVAIFGVLALCFSLAAMSRGYKRGQAKAGLILSVIILLCCVLAVVGCIA